MELNSEYGNRSEKPITANQESEDRNQTKPKPSLNKKKIIRKKNKSKAKQTDPIEHSTVAEVKSPNTMAPFGIFQSQTQKCQRLEHYLRKDIDNFYKLQIQSSQTQALQNLLNCNLIQLSDVYQKDLSAIWKQKICSLSEIKSYLEIVAYSKDSNSNFTIIFDQTVKKIFACFSNQNNSLIFYEVTQFQVQLLRQRQKFFQLLRSSQQKFQKKLSVYSQSNGHHKMSDLAIQIAFLFKSLYDSTKHLKNYLSNIKNNAQIQKQKQKQTQTQLKKKHELPSQIQSKYISCLIKKLVINSLKDEEIDYLNFFKNNELVEHNYGPPQAVLCDQKQFQEFMRKKKNKKGKKGKYVLHTACLGCCSSYYQQYNPFSYCQQCYIRFHRSCYAGYPARQQILYLNSREQKDLLCQACYNKKINPNYKTRGNECDYCGLKGLLNVPAGQFKRIHIFCMLLNGLWTVNNSKLQFKSKTDNKVPNSDTLKCLYCNSGIGYLHFCNTCQKYVHVSCAYFNGWKIQAQFDQQSQNVQLKMECCGDVALVENQKRRKFVTNYKKQAYSF